jgi:hypothetical protein
MAKFKLLFPIIIVFCFLSTIKPSIQAQEQDKTTPEGFNSIEDTVKFINNTLSSYPGKDGESYSQTTQLSVKSNGKLVFYTQYNNSPVEASGITAREEIHIDELDSSKNNFFTKNKYLILNVHCKDSYSHCVQRFFRDSNTKSFRPTGYADEVIILTSLNIKKANMVVEALNQLVKLYQTSLTPNKKADETVDSSSTSISQSKRSEIPALRSETPTLRKTASLTMEDIERPRPAKPANKKAPTKPTPAKSDQANTNADEKSEQTQSIEELLKMLDSDQ